MPRRALGIVLLAIVVVTAVASGRLGGLRVAGEAVALPGLGAPAVGDCVADVHGPVSVGLPTGSITVTTASEKSVHFADCSGSHVGEVVAARTVGQGADSLSNDAWCGGVATGLTSSAAGPAQNAPGAPWTPAPGPRFMVILGALPGASSFKWAACAVTSPGFEAYHGSFVQSLTDGATPSPFGVCRPGADSLAWASCSGPHPVQEFGTTTALSPDAEQSCQQLIAHLTGMPDISVGGLLQTDVVGQDGNGNANGSADGKGDGTSAAASCELSVVGKRVLDGTLIGVGTGPVPWA
ncbi:MAG TPA: hypothetical protein VII33_02165 [Nakamurella sp.]